jgi:hypothetical protein
VSDPDEEILRDRDARISEIFYFFEAMTTCNRTGSCRGRREE